MVEEPVTANDVLVAAPRSVAPLSVVEAEMILAPVRMPLTFSAPVIVLEPRTAKLVVVALVSSVFPANVVLAETMLPVFSVAIVEEPVTASAEVVAEDAESLSKVTRPVLSMLNSVVVEKTPATLEVEAMPKRFRLVLDALLKMARLA